MTVRGAWWYNVPHMSVKTNRPHTVRLRVSDAEMAFLERVASEEDRSVSAVVRLALRDFADAREGSEGTCTSGRPSVTKQGSSDGD